MSEEPVICAYCGEPISESDQDLMVEGMHEGCFEEMDEAFEESVS